LRERYNDWAKEYDQTLKEWGWSGPQFTAEIFAKHVPKDARVLDIGAGTGLVGEQLRDLGYTNLSALDLSQGMMDEARKKNIYRAFHQTVLGEPLDFESDSYDAVIGVGVFTFAHAPAHSLEELARIVQPGGHLALLARQDVYENHGLRDTFVALEKAGKLEPVEVSAPSVSVPHESDAIEHRAHIHRVLR
jgi:predicted TPR repeat methyltransferase